MQKISIFLLSIMMLFLNSCLTQRVMLVKGAKVNPDNPTFTESQPFFVAGIGQRKVMNINDACQGNATAIEMQYTVVDGLLRYITGSIYAPRTIKIYCQ